MKYSLTILALFLFAGISLAADLTVYNSHYVTAVNNYDWTMTKTADTTDLTFARAPDPNPQTVLFTIAITRTGPLSSSQDHGTISITNNDEDNPVTITRVKDSLVYENYGLPPGIFIDSFIPFRGSQIIENGSMWSIPYIFPFTTPYPLSSDWHRIYVIVQTDDGEIFQYSDFFHVDFPQVVNETLHVWDEYTVPSGFTATPTYTPSYNGSYWTTVSGNATLTLSLSLVNQSAATGSYELTNVGYGTNECGNWSSEVTMNLSVKPPTCDSEWRGCCYNHCYWRKHSCRFHQWLPITHPGGCVHNDDHARTILGRCGRSQSNWNNFLCYSLATKFNCYNDMDLLSAYYNDKSQTGEFMGGQTVAYIISIANTYNSHTPSATLHAMKDVFDAINNNAENHVLWKTNNGGNGTTVSLPNSAAITFNPNPFSNWTEIRFMTDNKEPATLKVYDITGTKVRDLVKNANSTLYWDGTDNNGRKLNSGVYVIRYEHEAQSTTLKVLINR
jgi:Secretion system C-terminal sorting domain